MAVNNQAAIRDYTLMIGEVTAVTGATNGTGDPAALRYDIFLRSVLNPQLTLTLSNHRVRRPAFKNVQVNAPEVGDAVFAVLTPKGWYVMVPEQLEFTENCA